MNGVRRVFPLFLLLLLTGCDAAPKPAVETRQQRQDREATAFFAGPIPSFEITVAPHFADQLRREPRKYVPATVRVGTNVFTSVGLHLKGAVGSSRSFDDRPALTLNFDKFKPGQDCFGLDKLHLNNSVQDDSRLNEAVASGLYRDAGVPTARSTHALLRLNGRDLDLYVLKEGYDGTFVRRNFPAGTNAPGNLYDGGFLQDIDQDLEREGGKGPADFSDLQRLRAAAAAPVAGRLAQLNATLDVDRFLTFLAIQGLTDDWDGYGRNRNNYRLYFEARTGQAVFIPHGMDQLFSNSGISVQPGWSAIMSQRALELPELRTRYRARLVSLATNLFTAAAMSNRLAAIETRLDAALTNRTAAERQQFAEVRGERRRDIFARVENVQRQLGTRPKAVGGPLPPLAGWQPKSQEGSAKLAIVKPPGGTETLHLAAKGGTVASFRTRLQLPAGSYSFTARAKSQGIAARTGPPGNGAGIRISGANRDNQLVGDRDWAPLGFDFDLDEDSDVEFIAELRADRGEVWFDLPSLKLTRR